MFESKQKLYLRKVSKNELLTSYKEWILTQAYIKFVIWKFKSYILTNIALAFSVSWSASCDRTTLLELTVSSGRNVVLDFSFDLSWLDFSLSLNNQINFNYLC